MISWPCLEGDIYLLVFCLYFHLLTIQYCTNLHHTLFYFCINQGTFGVLGGQKRKIGLQRLDMHEDFPGVTSSLLEFITVAVYGLVSYHQLKEIASCWRAGRDTIVCCVLWSTGIWVDAMLVLMNEIRMCGLKYKAWYSMQGISCSTLSRISRKN